METQIKVIQFNVYVDNNDKLTSNVNVNSLMFNDDEVKEILDEAFEKINEVMKR